jgi:Fe-S cluster assembly protein SufD
MTAVSEQIGNWLPAFNGQPAAEPWVRALREAAFQRFSELGFPTTHEEEWRFTNVAPIARKNWDVCLKTSEPPRPLPEAAREHLGRYAPQSNPFVALNTAFLNNVSVHQVNRGEIREGVEITHADPVNGARFPRTLILVPANAQLSIVETFKGSGAYFTNAVTEIVAGENAVVTYYQVQLESPEAFHVSTMQAQLGRNANFTSHAISLGGALVRNDAGAVLSEGTEATLNGLYIGTGTQHVDNHTVIDHAKPHGTSHELYKGILDGRAGAVFNGRIIVRKDAQKTDSKQTNKNLVLSDEAVINTKPELQILADDVRCTHGATIGQLDAESMFYLQSRGIARQDARNLLIYAFAQDIADRIKVESLRASIERILFEKFHEHSH